MADDKKDLIEPIEDGTFDQVTDALIGVGSPREEIIEGSIEERPISTWKGKLHLRGVDVPCTVEQ